VETAFAPARIAALAAVLSAAFSRAAVPCANEIRAAFTARQMRACGGAFSCAPAARATVGCASACTRWHAAVRFERPRATGVTACASVVRAGARFSAASFSPAVISWLSRGFVEAEMSLTAESRNEVACARRRNEKPE
jgi:hypothetical protein